MNGNPTQFSLVLRLIHWTMAALIVAMFFIGMTMVASLADYHVLVSIHRPLGIAILVLVCLRFVVRQFSPMPPFPPTMSQAERRIAHASELLMYALMFALPLIGWGMLSAARYPIVLFGSLHLPFILPHGAELYAVLRRLHSLLAYLFMLTYLAHFGAVLFHTFVVRDGILNRMVPWKARPPAIQPIVEGPSVPQGARTAT
jgi:cytochrome b561